LPSDANGVYSLPAGYLAVTGETILASQHNPPLEDLAESMSQRVMATGAKPFTGPLKLADGTVAAPGLAFANATSTGVYKTTDGVGVSVGGVQVAEFTAGGIKKGGHFLGELIAYTGLTAQPLTVLPYGQTLSRTTYADLWAFAQLEIAAGNTFYNNGNGSTTFGIGDMRGRVAAGKDNMGGVAASRLGSGAGMGGTPTIVGFAGGFESHTLTLAQLATGITSVNAAQSITVASNFGDIARGSAVSFTGGGPLAGVQAATFAQQTSTGSNSISVTSNNTSGTAHNNVQPTMITNFLLFAGA
jgi:microcystin-dependent protein